MLGSFTQMGRQEMEGGGGGGGVVSICASLGGAVTGRGREVAFTTQ